MQILACFDIHSVLTKPTRDVERVNEKYHKAQVCAEHHWHWIEVRDRMDT